MSRVKSNETSKFAAMIGGNLKFLRLNRQKFMPQKVPAAHIGVTHQQIEKYESGKNLPCSYRLQQFADFFEVTPNDILNPSLIHTETKQNEVLERAPGEQQ